MILGTISDVTTNGVTLTIDGDTSATTKEYMFLSPYYPENGDRVLIEEVGGQYVVLGKVISDPAQAAIARRALNADNATVAGTVKHVHNWYVNSSPTTDRDQGIQFKTSSASGSVLLWRHVSDGTGGTWHTLSSN